MNEDLGILQIGNLYGTEKEPNPVAGRIYDKQGLSPALRTMCGGNQQPIITDQPEVGLRIRKLTPCECWRLMGFDDESFHKAEAVNSNTQLYKQAGNSICVPVLEGIFANLMGVLNSSWLDDLLEVTD